MGLAMPVVWSDRHRLHDPGGEVWIGIRTPGTELPERAERIRAALAAEDARFFETEEQPDDAVLAVHDAALVDQERHFELAAVASLEVGKSRAESILEVQEAVDLIEAYAAHMERNKGYEEPLASFVDSERNTDVLRPYGAFAVISPFNFPVALTMGMASSALIAGNTVVLKPWSGTSCSCRS